MTYLASWIEIYCLPRILNFFGLIFYSSCFIFILHVNLTTCVHPRWFGARCFSSLFFRSAVAKPDILLLLPWQWLRSNPPVKWHGCPKARVVAEKSGKSNKLRGKPGKLITSVKKSGELEHRKKSLLLIQNNESRSRKKWPGKIGSREFGEKSENSKIKTFWQS